MENTPKVVNCAVLF